MSLKNLPLNEDDSRVSFTYGTLIADKDATSRVFAKIEIVTSMVPVGFIEARVPMYGAPVYFDIETNKWYDADEVSAGDAFSPNAIARQVLQAKEELETEKAKVAAMDATVKLLTTKGDPRIAALTQSLSYRTTELNRYQQIAEARLNDNRLLATSLKEQSKENGELKEKVAKLTNDLLTTATQRDNDVEELAVKRAKELTPNLRREVAFFKDRATTLGKELEVVKKVNEKLVKEAEVGERHDEITVVQYERELRKLNKKLHKAGGRERALRKHSNKRFGEVIELQKTVAALNNSLATVNIALKQERVLNKELRNETSFHQKMANGLSDESKAFKEAYVQATAHPQEKVIPLEPVELVTDGKSVTVIYNVTNMVIHKQNNYA